MRLARVARLFAPAAFVVASACALDATTTGSDGDVAALDPYSAQDLGDEAFVFDYESCYTGDAATGCEGASSSVSAKGLGKGQVLCCVADPSDIHR